ncbi:ADP-ribosylglycohydrolase family protein, partial [Actinospica acidiphila]|nr:ADP-ribosylglycohydrolase family protein [Actinospica acidiphila]
MTSTTPAPVTDGTLAPAPGQDDAAPAPRTPDAPAPRPPRAAVEG